MSILKRSRLLLGTLVTLFVFASISCGSGGSQSTANHSETSADSAGTTAGSGDAQTTPSDQGQAATTTPAADQAATPAAEPGVVHLVDKGCVQFEPHWVTIAPGQTVTWVSDLKAPVTVHVDAGAFNKTSFVVAPGARVTSGPAGSAKDYKVWTDPNACQGAPLGARGSGPGIAVQTADH
jgi:plastocyanin